MGFNINNRRYTGSKYKIREWIRNIILEECHDAKSFCELFAGTSVITATLINDFQKYYLNDLLYSNEIIYQAFYSKKNYNDDRLMKYYKLFRDLIPNQIKENYVSRNYGDRFFAIEDALQIGYIRDEIANIENKLNKKEYAILMASLIYSLDRCANTVGHYDAYFKGKKLNSNFRFELINPIIKSSQDKREIYIYREDANQLARKIKADIVYIDPPYSSRQYSRFYHLLENIVEWEKPELFGAALKPEPENMSEYCKTKAIDFFKELIYDINAKYIVVSYNNTYRSKSNSSRNKMTLEEIEQCLSLKGETLRFIRLIIKPLTQVRLI